MRHAVLIVLLGLGLGCSVSDLLEGKSCNAGADCGRGQTCIRTLAQSTADELGICSSEGACLAGEQLGCVCDNARACTTLTGIEHPDEEDATGAPLCFCCNESACGSGQEAVVGQVRNDPGIGLHADCQCCETCMEGEVNIIDDEGDCDCVPE